MKCPIVTCKNKNSGEEALCREDAKFLEKKNIKKGSQTFKLFESSIMSHPKNG